jgi:hypothetical protein
MEVSPRHKIIRAFVAKKKEARARNQETRLKKSRKTGDRRRKIVPEIKLFVHSWLKKT